MLRGTQKLLTPIQLDTTVTTFDDCSNSIWERCHSGAKEWAGLDSWKSVSTSSIEKGEGAGQLLIKWCAPLRHGRLADLVCKRFQAAD
jgi:hypothetical protein